MFTMDNTAGFSPAELTELNNALDALIAEGWDEKSASDMLNNAWPRIVWPDAGALRHVGTSGERDAPDGGGIYEEHA